METTEMNVAQDRQCEEQEAKQEEGDSHESNPSGAAALRRAVDLALLKSADQIAMALVERSIKGHIQSTKLLYSLSEAQEKGGESQLANKLRISLVDEWEADKKWLAELRRSADTATDGAHAPE